MLKRRIGFTRDGRPSDFGTGEVPWSSAASSWSGFLIEGHDAKGPFSLPAGTTRFAHPLVLLYTGGQAALRYRIRSREYERHLVPGMVRILTGEYELSAISWTGPHSLLAVEVAVPKLGSAMPWDEPPDWSGLDPHVGTQDIQLASLVRAMYAEIAAGCPAGKLFGESLSSTLAAYLLGRYGSVTYGATNGNRRPGLSPASSRRVLEYIQANLTSDLSLAELAGTVHLSPHHFSLLFKNSFGVSPYQYVIRERVDRAKAMLSARRMPIVEIAATLGFSSQSHFTSVFRKATGKTPRSYQR